MFKFTGACTYTQFSCFSAVSLADADFRVQFLEKAVIFKHFQSRDEITIAGTAGFYFANSIDFGKATFDDNI